jgi:hypothetical protein
LGEITPAGFGKLRSADCTKQQPNPLPTSIPLPTPTPYVPFPFVLSPAARHVADRLASALMALLRAVAPSDTAASTPTLPQAAAQTLFFRLAHLVTHLIRISNFGVRTPTNPKPATQAPDHPAPAAKPSQPTRTVPAANLPRRPGWLLAALPEIAPSVAAEIGALLADPAIATLLDLAPSLHRILRPLLRGLGLNAAPPIPTPPHPPSSSTKPPGATPPTPIPAPPRTSNPPIPATVSKRVRPNTPPCHVIFVATT